MIDTATGQVVDDLRLPGGSLALNDIQVSPDGRPYLVKGKLPKAAQRGQRIFSSKATRCAECHPGPLFTDMKAYDVGTRGAFDKETDTFDTPTLIEDWRTGPYLHDGSATLREVLVEGNRNDCHGNTSHVTPKRSTICSSIFYRYENGQPGRSSP